MLALTQLVVVFYLVTTPVRTEKVDLTPKFKGLQNCTTRDNKPGFCVHESACNENHTILHGGDVHDSDFREKKPCTLQVHWCCTDTEVIPHPQIGNTHHDKCLAPTTDVCPWCVLLYNVVDVKKRAHHPYCLGALIGSRVVLTAATCLLAAQEKALYARAPNSATPWTNYSVTRRECHPQYNSGTHAYDFGILVLEDDVTFKKGKPRGACVDLQSPLEGGCVAYGFDDKGEITSTIMEVQNNNCSKHGSSIDAACGVKSDQTACIVAVGGPVLCPTKRETDLYLVGIARSTCSDDDKATLGGVLNSREWIETILGLMKINKDVYT